MANSNIPEFALREFVDLPISDASVQKLTSSVAISQLIGALANTEVPGSTHELIIKVLSKCIRVKDIRISILRNPQLSSHLKDASDAQSLLIRQLLSELTNLAASDSEGRAALMEANMAPLLIGLLMDEDLKVSQSAEGAILSALKSGESLSEQLFVDSTASSILNRMNTCGEEVQIRLFNFFILVGRESESLFHYLSEKGIYERMLNVYFTDDVLMKVVAVEMIRQFSDFPRGITYICREDTINKLLRDLRNPYLNRNVRFAVLHILAECVQKYPLLTTTIFEGCDHVFTESLKGLLAGTEHGTDRVGQLICFIHCWCCVNSHAIGASALAQWIPDASMQVAGFVSNREGTQVAVSAISAWETILHQPNKEVAQMLMPCTADVLVPNTLTTLIGNPTQEHRPRSYDLYTALAANYTFAVESFLSSEKHRRLLVDPNSEAASTAYKEKYNFAKSLYTNQRNIIIRLAGEKYFEQLEAYIKGGMYFRPRGDDFSIGNAAL